METSDSKNFASASEYLTKTPEGPPPAAYDSLSKQEARPQVPKPVVQTGYDVLAPQPSAVRAEPARQSESRDDPVLRMFDFAMKSARGVLGGLQFQQKSGPSPSRDALLRASSERPAQVEPQVVRTPGAAAGGATTEQDRNALADISIVPVRQLAGGGSVYGYDYGGSVVELPRGIDRNDAKAVEGYRNEMNGFIDMLKDGGEEEW